MTESHAANLKKALATARTQLEQAIFHLAPTHVGGEQEAYDTAYEKMVAIERELANVEHRAYAIRQDCATPWDTGAPLPTLLQSEHHTLLFFLLADSDLVGRIEFEGCLATCFGNPGDETLTRHPLYGSGFEPYRAMRVMNSPWVERLREMDSVHPQHDPSTYAALRHFIFSFHDVTFECVARSFRSSRLDGPFSDAVKTGVDQLL